MRIFFKEDSDIFIVSFNFRNNKDRVEFFLEVLKSWLSINQSEILFRYIPKFKLYLTQE